MKRSAERDSESPIRSSVSSCAIDITSPPLVLIALQERDAKIARLEAELAAMRSSRTETENPSGGGSSQLPVESESSNVDNLQVTLAASTSSNFPREIFVVDDDSEEDESNSDDVQVIEARKPDDLRLPQCYRFVVILSMVKLLIIFVPLIRSASLDGP